MMSYYNPEATVARTGLLSGSAAYFPNVESFAGEIFTKPPTTSAREEGRKSRKDIVRAARHIERQSEHIRGGIDKKADYVVGPRLMVNPRPDWEMLGITDKDTQEKIVKSMRREFRNWGYDTRLLQDGEGHYDFGGMMWLAFRNLTAADGECAGVIHYDEKRAKAYRTRWATYFTVIDPDRIETPADHVGNDNVQDGMILDPDGRWIGFFARKHHPGDFTGDPSYAMVPRETSSGRPVGLHWFVKNRAAALRGISTLVTIIKQTGMVDKFDDAYLAAAIINQVLGTWIESAAPPEVVAENLAPAAPTTQANVDAAWTMFDKKLNYYDKAKMRIGGNRLAVVPPGDKIVMEAVNRAMEDPSALRDGFLRMFSSALGLSFEQLGQKFGDANMSSARMAITDAWVNILKLRMWFGQHYAAPIYGAVIEEAWKKGRLDGIPAGADFDENRAAWTSCEFFGPAMPQPDPEKEAKAQAIRLDKKLTSRRKIMAQEGENLVDVFDDIQLERQEAEDRDFELDPLAPGTPGAAGAETGTPDGGDGEPKPKPKKRGAGGEARDGDGDGATNEDQ